MSDNYTFMCDDEQETKTSKYLGVYWDNVKLKWDAVISVNREQKYLGSFDREQDAALRRDYHVLNTGEQLNFPERPKWDEYYMFLAEAIKLRSPDYYKVGAVLVSTKDNRLISTGYNGLPSKIDESSVNWSDRESVYEIIIHAETNALLYANSQFGDSILYTTTSPCKSCLKLLSAAKIKKIVYKHKYRDFDRVKELAKFFDIELVEYR